MINQDDFDVLVELIKEGCGRQAIPMHIINDLVNIIVEKKTKICTQIIEEKNNMSLIDTFEEQNILVGLIKRFFLGIEESGMFDKLDEQEAKDRQSHYAVRISKILLGSNQEDLDIDFALLDMPINSSDPLFVAAEIFRDTMLEVGNVTEAVAEMARSAFYAMRMDKEE